MGWSGLVYLELPKHSGVLELTSSFDLPESRISLDLLGHASPNKQRMDPRLPARQGPNQVPEPGQADLELHRPWLCQLSAEPVQ